MPDETPELEPPIAAMLDAPTGAITTVSSPRSPTTPC